MKQPRVTGHHVVLVRNGAGEIVHTHQVIDFEDPEPLGDQALLDHGLAAAKRAHPEADDLVASQATKEDLEHLRAEGGARIAFSGRHGPT
jgi:hypothetical protein